MELNKELLTKAKAAKTAEEIMALAKENGIEMTAEEAQKIFAQLHSQSGELSDDELDNVSGGACYGRDDCLMTTIAYGCRYYEPATTKNGVNGTCGACRYWDRTYRSGLEIFGMPLLCVHPKNKKRK